MIKPFFITNYTKRLAGKACKQNVKIWYFR